ncbi:hypothetical protein IG193_07490 [Infirmifilum lucidum]|uniref:Uncharacterized protein n=1 Tax=Infirmifilum lucidum TaxID=2776706 RepID=A0A7L9FH00_9CREN|nr:hypothetical protein [Infirmifilum lucidum]QOJ78592.1 hypothetical protein IG193_07490 [Infirmifilum lucidum]
MEDFHQSPSKLVASGKIKVLFSEEGDVLYLDIDGSVYEGIGDTVPVPLWRLRRLRLKEIPKDVYIEPAESIHENIVHTLRYSSKLSFLVKMGRDHALVELDEWARWWGDYIGFYAYMEALSTVLEEAEDAGYIDDLYIDFADDTFFASFRINLPGDMTIFKAINVVKKILFCFENEAEYQAALLALREIKKILKRSGNHETRASFLDRLEEIFNKYGL